MPSTKENKFLDTKVYISYNDRKLKVNVYDTSLGQRFVDALKDNLLAKRILEKNF